MRGYVPNPHFAAEVAASAAMHAAERATAEAVRREADRIGHEIKAPWMPRKGTGRQTFVVVQSGDETAVLNQDSGGHLMEWGGANNPPHAPLRRAARAAGLDLK